jgi:hypothetical protein
MLRRLSVMAAVVSLVTVGWVSTASTATAAPGDYFEWSIPGAAARFYPYGEVLWARDTAADGHHVEVYYYTSNNSYVSVLKDYDGNGTHTTANLSIPESGWITVDACVAEGSTLLSCTGWSPYFSANG